jgi:hypothetical protein
MSITIIGFGFTLGMADLRLNKDFYLLPYKSFPSDFSNPKPIATYRSFAKMDAKKVAGLILNKIRNKYDKKKSNGKQQPTHPLRRQLSLSNKKLPCKA